MLWLPMVSLAVLMLVAVAAFALMFWDVAFGVPERWTRHWPSAAWRLPNFDGQPLRQWAANLTRRVITRQTNLPRSAETPLAIAAELEAGVNVALEQVGAARNAAPATTCPDTRPHYIPVTVPEVLVIADELQRKCPPAELHRIREVARANALRARLTAPNEFADAGIQCPLHTQEGYCLTFLSRPIACRRLCPNCVGIGTDGATVSPSTTHGELRALTDDLHHGLSTGLSQGLHAAGLDGETYELNDALATALATPDAANRWLQGEPLFTHCVKA